MVIEGEGGVEWAHKAMEQGEPVIKFETLQPDGKVTNVRYLRQSDIRACPNVIFAPSHYRPDGSCRCDDAEERAKMIREWGYEADDFEGPTREEAKA